ncbi:MAG: hypothetical protein EHM79_10390 [Geobacter sp.]|nr:MAG: hypothetical protein EHM79_10390 [Geobacter sp.]
MDTTLPQYDDGNNRENVPMSGTAKTTCANCGYLSQGSAVHFLAKTDRIRENGGYPNSDKKPAELAA